MSSHGRRERWMGSGRTLMARGVASLLFGLLTLGWPRITVATAVFAFSCYLIIDGLLSLWAASLVRPRRGGRVVSVVQAFFELAAGVLGIAFPAYAATYVIVGIGLWALAIGLVTLVGTVLFWRQTQFKYLLVLGSFLVGALGAKLAVSPVIALEGANGVLGLITATGVIVGALLLLLAYAMRPVVHEQAGKARAG